MRFLSLKTVIGATLAIALLIVFTSEKVSSDQRGGGRLEGTWDVVLSVRNCDTGNELRHFPELATFMFGGTMLDSTSGMPQSAKTPGHGVWNHLSGDTYSFTFKALTFNAAGALSGSVKVTHTVVLSSDANEYSSAGGVEIYDASGSLVGRGCSTSTATRLE